MSQKILEDLKEFLKSAKLSGYEISAYTTLLLSNHLTAKEMSEKSNVPTGRIYEVLENLNSRGMIEIQEGRPKMYRALPFNQAFNKLISYLNQIHKIQTNILIDEAKVLESKLFTSNIFIKKAPSRILWSTAYGARSIISMYVTHYRELKEELLVNNFINKNTIKIIPYGNKLFEGIYNAVNRGVDVKVLWSFEHDERPLSDKHKTRNLTLYDEVKNKIKDSFNLSSDMEGFEMRFVYKRIPTSYDIFDNKRIFIKLQNPIQPSQIFACMNIFDPNLANKLREKFNQMWLFETIKEKL